MQEPIVSAADVERQAENGRDVGVGRALEGGGEGRVTSRARRAAEEDEGVEEAERRVVGQVNAAVEREEDCVTAEEERRGEGDAAGSFQGDELHVDGVEEDRRPQGVKEDAEPAEEARVR